MPKGLLFTTILAPWLYLKVWQRRQQTFIRPFAVFILTYAVLHLWYGVHLRSFLVSNILLTLVFFFTVSLWHFVNGYEKLSRLFRQMLVFNFFMTLIALPFLFAPPEYRQWFWYINKLTKGLENFPRLAMFTYEASYYSLLIAPLVFYYVLKFVLGQFTRYRWATLVMTLAPLLLSLSFGVLGAMFITALIMASVNIRSLFRYRKPFVITTSVLGAMLLTFVILLLWWPENPLFIRLSNIWAGADTSARGRTIESFEVAWRLAADKNILFGVGMGQVKIVIVDVVKKFYNYWGDLPRYDIPNAMGETLGIFGMSGVVLRLTLEGWLFVKTRVYNNHYRLALFIFIFIYQFTGSFITNVIEYCIWVLAFAQIFPQFNRRPLPPAGENFSAV